MEETICCMNRQARDKWNVASNKSGVWRREDIIIWNIVGEERDLCKHHLHGLGRAICRCDLHFWWIYIASRPQSTNKMLMHVVAPKNGSFPVLVKTGTKLEQNWNRLSSFGPNWNKTGTKLEHIVQFWSKLEQNWNKTGKVCPFLFHF